jgi:hypothetical protein
MHLSTTARNCLYLNWALPLGSAPALPEPLRYETHGTPGDEYVFVSILLFRLTGLHLRNLPLLRVSYPQMNLRLYVLDGEGMPSVLFLRTLVPFWVVPVSYLLGRQPVTPARFSYPVPNEHELPSSWRWVVQGRHRLELQAVLSTPRIGPGPSLGSWETTVAHFQRRPRGYALWENRLRSVQTSHPRVEVCPVTVDFAEVKFLEKNLNTVDSDVWHTPHSAWICPEIPFIFELGRPISLPLPGYQIPATEGLCRFVDRVLC